jgi:hypothetical protein
MQLTLIESAFCCLKTDLTIRPLYQTFAVGRLEPHRPVLTPKAVLENLSAFKHSIDRRLDFNHPRLLADAAPQPGLDGHLLSRNQRKADFGV